MKTGILQVYSGDGKGKTTAAIGQAVRAHASGLKVLVLFFNKKDSPGTGENNVLKKIGISTFYFAENFTLGETADPDASGLRKATLKGLYHAQEALSSEKYDMVILDEILVSLKLGFISETELLQLIEKKGAGTELIFTGRGLTDTIKDRADLVTEMKKIKHPYDNGMNWRQGIER
ncbi:MAG: cob(I)yrinic acid a,c-diamide adenosyltransferase [Elusimicrobiota bacterium]